METGTSKITAYKAFGLNVLSQLPLPELPQIEIDSYQEDIEIKAENLLTVWEELASDNQYFYFKENFVLFRIPEVAIFLVKNGTEIFFSSMENVHEDQLRLFVLGTCMGAILIQRKVLPLHGSAVVIDNKAYAIVGNSGAGKSTLASSFLNKGYQLLSDDVIPVTLNEENIPIVTPAYPQQKLWLESLKQFGLDSDGYRPIFDRETKFAIPVPHQFTTEPKVLAGVIELVKTEDETIEIQQIQSLERLNTMFCHTYRNFFIAPLGLIEWHFNITAKMVNKIELFQLRRPISRFTANDLTEIILSTIRQEEKVL